MDIQTKLGALSGKLEHRRSTRFPVVLDAEVKWHGPDGRIRQTALVSVASAHGGLLRMKTYPRVGEIIELTNMASAKSAKARVATMCGLTADGLQSVGVELLEPNATFWAMDFKLLSPF